MPQVQYDGDDVGIDVFSVLWKLNEIPLNGGSFYRSLRERLASLLLLTSISSFSLRRCLSYQGVSHDLPILPHHITLPPCCVEDPSLSQHPELWFPWINRNMLDIAKLQILIYFPPLFPWDPIKKTWNRRLVDRLEFCTVAASPLPANSSMCLSHLGLSLSFPWPLTSLSPSSVHSSVGRQYSRY